jgi:hypothetical protein
MRAGAAVLALAALAACSRGTPGERADAGPDAPHEDRVRCALDGARDFSPVCLRDVSQGPDGELWVIHHPDGGFRRFVLIDKGTRIATADGAEEVQTDRIGKDLEVRVAGNRYLFPVASPEPKAAAPDAPAS